MDNITIIATKQTKIIATHHIILNHIDLIALLGLGSNYLKNNIKLYVGTLDGESNTKLHINDLNHIHIFWETTDIKEEKNV